MEILPTDILYNNIHKYLFQYYDNILKPEEPNPEESNPEEPNPIDIRQYLLDHVSIVKPIEGRLRLTFTGIDVPDKSILNNVSILDGEGNEKDYNIELNEITTYEKSFEISFTKTVAQYYLYVLGVYYEGILPANTLITDWMALHVRTYTFFDYFRLVFLSVPDNQIPTLETLEAISLPLSINMLADIYNVTNSISKVGNINSSVIISSAMFTRREIVKMKLIDIATLRARIVSLENRVTALETLNARMTAVESRLLNAGF